MSTLSIRHLAYPIILSAAQPSVSHGQLGLTKLSRTVVKYLTCEYPTHLCRLFPSSCHISFGTALRACTTYMGSPLTPKKFKGTLGEISLLTGFVHPPGTE